MSKITKILITQPKPNDSNITPFNDLSAKYNVKFEFVRFFNIETVSVREFRDSKTYINDFTAVIFNSKSSVDHFFNLAKNVRLQVKETMKYFCISESIANYLQKYVQYRKRKIFFTNQSSEELINLIKKNNSEIYLLPCSENTVNEFNTALEEAEINFKQTIMYRTIPADLATQIDIKNFDIVVFYSPKAIESLFQNWPNYKQGTQTIATFGASTKQFAKDSKLRTSIVVPTSKCVSMTNALENFLIKNTK